MTAHTVSPALSVFRDTESAAGFVLPRLTASPLSPYLARDVPFMRIGHGIGLVGGPTVGVRDRAGALAVALAVSPRPYLGDTATLAGHSAAWVWCGGDAPETIAVTHPLKFRAGDGLAFSAIDLHAGDVRYPGSIPVVAPHRVFLELATHPTNDTDPQWARALVLTGWTTVHELTQKSLSFRQRVRRRPKEQRRTLRYWASRYRTGARIAEEILAAEGHTAWTARAA